jgi:CubicO group peptidase (beta-lactamase class C family)
MSTQIDECKTGKESKMKKLRLRLSKISATLGIFCLLIIYSNGFAQTKVQKIEALLSQYHEYGQFNGAALVAENGKVIFRKGFGMANMEWDIPNMPDTKFRVGSITKQFTAMMVMQLVEQGKLKLDGKITDYMPDYPKSTGDKVTIHHLLNHTSGIPGYTEFPNFFRDVSRDPYAPQDFAKTFADSALQFEPGSKFTYSNSGYFLLGVIIEKMTGKPYEQVLAENILTPLNMKSTGYDHYNTIIKKRAAGYQKSLNGYDNAPYLDMSIPYSAGALYSTAEDLYLWDQALHTDKLVSEKLKELMFKPQISAFGKSYAYGWVVGKAPVGQTTDSVLVIEHGGGINGFNTLISRMPQNKHLIVLFSNAGGAPLNAMSQSIRGILFDKPYDLAKKSIAETIFATIMEKGIAPALAQYRELKEKPSQYALSEGEMNIFGYQLLQMKKVKEAIEIFKLNVEAFPQSSNVYDSLGEAYMINGDKELAIKNYEKSIELNPQNANGIEMLKKLRAN